MGRGTEPEVSLRALRAKVDRAETAWRRAHVALVALAEALGTPDSVPAALDRAEATLHKARVALSELKVAQGAAVSLMVPLGTLVDEDLEQLWQHRAEAEAAAEVLECEERLRRQQLFWTGLRLAMGLIMLCAGMLSLNPACAALGVAEDSLLRGFGTSRRHLATAAARQREMAKRLHHHAERVKAARERVQAITTTNKATAAVLGRLEEVTLALGTLVVAVTRDREVMPWGTRRQGFPNAARALGDIVVALGTSGQGHEEVARRMEVVQGTLAAQG